MVPYNFYIYSFIFFFLDIAVHGLLQEKFLHILLCFYSISIFQFCSKARILFLVFLLSIQGFLVSGYYGVSLAYLVPLTGIIMLVNPLLNPSYRKTPCVTTFIICFIGYHVTACAFSTAISADLRYYTLYELFVNIIVLSICLKYFKGRWDNRF